MIRINLLGLKKEVKKPAGSMPSISLQGTMLVVLAIAFTVAGFGWVGYRYVNLNSEADKIAANIKREEDESKRLATVKASFEAMDATKKRLMKQIDVIEGLERGRTGPLEMLYALANTVVATKTLWLTSFDNTGNKITIQGEATSISALADFMSNLRKTGHFANLEIKEASQDEKYKDISAFIFEMSADIVTPPSGAPPVTAPGQSPMQGKGK